MTTRRYNPAYVRALLAALPWPYQLAMLAVLYWLRLRERLTTLGG